MDKIIKKLPIDDMWNMGKSESWYSDMAKEGLHLKGFGHIHVKFEKGEPSQTRYRIDILYKKPSHEQLDVYKDCGWDFIANTGVFYVFSSPEGSNAPELHTDLTEQSFTLDNLNKILKRNVIIIVISILFYIGMILGIMFLYDEPYLFFIDGDFILPVLVTVISICSLFSSIRNYTYIKELKKSLINGIPINHKENWKKAHVVNKVINIISLLIAVAGIILPVNHMIKCDEYTLPESKNNLPIIMLADIEENPDLIRESKFYDDVDWHNRVTYNWGVLAPVQYEIVEKGIVNSEMWPDSSGIYSPSIHTDFYKLSFNSMKEGLIKDLIHRNIYEPETPVMKAENEHFDQLYYAVSNITKYVFASWDNNVIFIRYYGNKDINHIIRLLSDLTNSKY